MTGDGLIIRTKTYREQVRILGLANWVRLNGGRLWGKGAKPGSRLTVSTPLALHPLAMRAHTSDMFVFTQIFSHREYECLDHVDEASLIVDCGANVGYSSAYFLSRFPKAHLIAIEPDPNNFAVLKENLKPYGKRSTAILAGVWSSMTGLVISHPRLGAREEWGVTVRPARADEEPQIMAVDLGTVLEESNFDRI